MTPRSKDKRVRDKQHMAWVRQHSCLICGLPYTDAHHLTFMGEPAMSMKVGDNWTVPLCRAHHMELHDGELSERDFWMVRGVDPVPVAEGLWTETQTRRQKTV